MSCVTSTSLLQGPNSAPILALRASRSSNLISLIALNPPSGKFLGNWRLVSVANSQPKAPLASNRSDNAIGSRDWQTPAPALAARNHKLGRSLDSSHPEPTTVAKSQPAN